LPPSYHTNNAPNSCIIKGWYNRSIWGHSAMGLCLTPLQLIKSNYRNFIVQCLLIVIPWCRQFQWLSLHGMRWAIATTYILKTLTNLVFNW
jgi:hypothetical protein